MRVKNKLQFKVGKHYELYDPDRGLIYAQYKGNDGPYHLFIFGEGDKKCYTLVHDNMAEVKEIIMHSPIAPCPMDIIEKEEVQKRLNAWTPSNLLNILTKLGEKI